MADPMIFKILAAITLGGAIAFVVLFAREPWRRSEFGRSLMLMAVAVLLFTLTSTLRQFFGTEYPGRTEIRVVAQGFLAYAMWSRFFVLLRLRRGDRLPRTSALSKRR